MNILGTPTEKEKIEKRIEKFWRNKAEIEKFDIENNEIEDEIKAYALARQEEWNGGQTFKVGSACLSYTQPEKLVLTERADLGKLQSEHPSLFEVKVKETAVKKAFNSESLRLDLVMDYGLKFEKGERKYSIKKI
jgi:hypothetical protein